VVVANSWRWFMRGISCAAMATAAVAAPFDETLENDGTWQARMDGDAATVRRGRVVISNWQGHWQELGPRRRGDACRGAKPFPITVQKSTNREVEFTVWASLVRADCPDFALTLRVVDERTLAGTTPDGREIRLTREPPRKRAAPR
jgi:hypothetical protein